ncbi:MAG: undecaprenyl-diphosphate phosphatase [Myxococcales bacterium]|nr:undecaprenyl-diphosphate phosphatase [Myxococcales bacterium]
MEWWQALILGLVEGITEYLPVSSTGHLLVVERMLGFGGSEAAHAYAIVIQAGAIMAVLGLYRQRVAGMVSGLVGNNSAGAHLARMVVLAFLPAATLGFFADDVVEDALFGPWPIVVAWAAGGLFLLILAPKLHKRPGQSLENLAWTGALWIGVIQCCALWPGVSRSLATILGGIAVGLSLPAAVEFSFLLGLVTLGAASVYKAVSSGAAMVTVYDIDVMVIGFGTAWISAAVAVRWMVRWLNERGFALFGWWRLVAASVVGGLLLFGKL